MSQQQLMARRSDVRIVLSRGGGGVSGGFGPSATAQGCSGGCEAGS